MTVYLFALGIGVVAGLRAMTAPAAVAWTSSLGWLASPWTRWIFTLLAVGELVNDQLPKTPPRTVPVQFGTRIVSGAVCGGAIAAPRGSIALGAVAGAVGAVIGTLGGKAARAKLAAAFGGDRPAAILEDVVAIAGGILIAWAAR